MIKLKKPINLSNSIERRRYIIREGQLTRLRLKNRRLAEDKKHSRKLEKLYIFFFSDMLIFTKLVQSTLTNPKYVVQIKPLKVSEVAVRNVPDASDGIGAQNVFLVSTRVTGTMVLQASSLEEKQLWINDFMKENLLGTFSLHLNNIKWPTKTTK